jgi:alpha-L-fucosidase
MEGMDAEGDFAGDFGTPEQEIPATGDHSCFQGTGPANVSHQE